MADPRSNLFSVKPCPPATMGKSFANISSATAERKNFFGALGKVGDLEVLNDIGASEIGKGLRTLSSISDTVRQGCGALPTAIGNVIGGGLEAGTEWVLNNVGIARTAVEAVKQFHPNIANQAYGQAQQIYEKVKQGDFKITDIPYAMQDLQNLERLSRNIFTPSTADNQALTEHCEASPYAVDMIARAPKFKFLYVVQITCNPGYEGMDELDMAFVVKKASRPNVTFTMEDVNYYNFRTKVITKTQFEEMEISFHDDTQNYATQFYATYLKSMSPITNMSDTANLATAESDGMNFTRLQEFPEDQDLTGFANGGIPQNFYTGSRGPLVDNNVQIIKEIKIFHIYDFGQKMNVFKFLNPRISNMVLDPLDMSIGNEGSEVTFKFNYDTVYIDTDVPMNDKTYSIEQLGRNATYPLRYNDGTSEGPTNAGFSVNGTPAGASDKCGIDTDTRMPPMFPSFGDFL